MLIKDWKMNFKDHIGLECTAPASMYSVLLEKGLIPDPAQPRGYILWHFSISGQTKCEYPSHRDTYPLPAPLHPMQR